MTMTVTQERQRVALYGDGALHTFDVGDMGDLNRNWANLPHGWYWLPLSAVEMVIPIAPRGWTEYRLGLSPEHDDVTIDERSGRALLDQWSHHWDVDAYAYVAGCGCYGCATMRHECTGVR